MVDFEQRIHELSEEFTRVKLEHSTQILRHEANEKILKDLLRKQRKLVAHFIDFQEESRKSIAREIHEDLGQMLASIQLNVALMTLGYTDHLQLSAQAKTVEQLIVSTIETVQRISSTLRPIMLDQLGLAEAID